MNEQLSVSRNKLGAVNEKRVDDSSAKRVSWRQINLVRDATRIPAEF